MPLTIKTLNLTRLPLRTPTGQITIQTLNGAPQGSEAFVARIGFRDEDGVLILPPYDGFTPLLDGFQGFYVAGGQPDAPRMTRHNFTAPQGARQIEIELRRNKCQESPCLLEAPDLIAAAHTVAFTPIYQLAMTDDVIGVELSVINGRESGKKAYLACVRFLNTERIEIRPPHSGFIQSPSVGSYFYMPGGTRSRPALIRHTFKPPWGAVTMEVTLRNWSMKEPIRLANPPKVIRRKVAQPAQPAQVAASAPKDYLNLHIASVPMGSQIIAETVTADLIVGIMDDTLHQALGARVSAPRLPLDRYDLAFATPQPGYLLIQADALAHTPGWEHALTLRDPTATVELAVMLRKARARGIKTVLVSPSQSHKVPLLSRVAALFDITLPADASVSAALA